MCLRICCALHALWGIIYTAAGSVQLVAGIFFLLSLPILRMGSNICTGAVNVLIGVGTVMLSCFGDLTKSRSQKLITLTFLALFINVINLVVLEVGEWYLFLAPETREMISQHDNEELVFYARISTSLTTAVVILVAFLDSQFTYCSIQCFKNTRLRGIHTNETVSDIEYILPRHKPRPMSSKQSHILNQYSQSWVFDADTATSSQNESPYLKLSPSAPMETISEKSSRRHYQNPLHLQTPRVQVESPSEDGVLVSSNSRQMEHMESFSRTPSPSGQHFLFHESSTSSPQMYECLEPTVYRNRLETFLNTSSDSRPTSAKSNYGRLHYTEASEQYYSSLMMELEESFSSKPGIPESVPSSTSHVDESVSDRMGARGSDAEFSKELEAALKLIQDLESPNTIETPSDSCKTMTGTVIPKDEDGESGSSRTLSGKNNTLPLESQSTSGYNSPSPERLSQLSTSHGDLISKRETVFTPPKESDNPSDIVSVNVIISETNKSDTKVLLTEDNKTKFWKFKNFLKAKKQPALMPEVENAIVKSESLAFLTDSELEERLRQSNNLRRQIEANVQRKMSIRNAKDGSL